MCLHVDAASVLFVLFVLGPFVRLNACEGVQIDLFRLICTPVLVVFVQTADRTLLDRTTGSPFVFTLGFPLVLRRSVRTEVAVPRSPRSAAAVGRTRRVAARPRGSEPAPGRRSTRTRTAEAARTRACRAVFARPCLAHRQRTPFEWLLVEPADGFLGHGAVCVIDESEPSRPARLPVDGQDDLRRCADARQVFP
jgi:hypothetical protein